MDKPRCENCVYYRHYDSYCHRFPRPTKTLNDGWCGEFKEPTIVISDYGKDNHEKT